MECKRQGNVTAAQKEVIIDYMDKHDKLKKGKFSASFTFKDAQILWQDLSSQLNAVPGPQKQWKEWRKTWADLRNKIRSKTASIRRHQNGTGGGEPSRVNLSLQEARIKDLLDEVTIVGNDDILESNVTMNLVSKKVAEGTRVEQNCSISSDKEQIPNEDICNSEQEIFNKLVRDTDSDVLDEDVIHESVVTKSSLPKATKKKLQRRPRIATTRLRNSMQTAIDINNISKMKMEMKKEYFNAKLKLLERIASAKERIAVAQERSASAKERSASARERSASAREILAEIAQKK